MEKVDQNGPIPAHAPDLGPCWIFIGKANDGNGYPVLHYGGGDRTAKAYKVAWIETNGPVPEGMQLDHLCYERMCIRPSHLEPVPQQENLRRSRLAHASLDVCPHGHPRGPDNPYPKPCRFCAVIRATAWVRNQATRACEVCGANFQPRHRLTRTCSSACRMVLWRAARGFQ